ncbi:hypothetical protein Tco_0225561, partial [Tanacetum coccineum]
MTLNVRILDRPCCRENEFANTGNSWLWEVGGVKLLVDPILVGNLDFGIPLLYDASKKYLKNFQ